MELIDETKLVMISYVKCMRFMTKRVLAYVNKYFSVEMSSSQRIESLQ